MGCDIHVFAEVQDASGKWQYLPCNRETNDMVSDLYPDRRMGASTTAMISETFLYPEWYTGRNYTLFGILSGVRCMPDFGPLCDGGKKWPDDVSTTLIPIAMLDVGADCHTFSWATEWEIIEFFGDCPREPALVSFIGAIGAMCDRALGKPVRVLWHFDS